MDAKEYIHSLKKSRNLEIITSGDISKLIKKSKIVVGFNTTGILEGLAAGRTVIVPNFSECLSKDYRPFIPDFGKAVIEANSPNNLSRIIKKPENEKLARKGTK